MKLGRSSSRFVRCLIFLGVFIGSVFSGPVAYANLIPISTQSDLALIGTVDIKPLTGDYFLDFAGTELVLTAPAAGASTYIAGSFTGTLDGRGKTLSGLTAPLFDHLGTTGNGASVTDLVLEATGTSFVGHGILANDSNNVVIDTVSTEAIGAITSGSDRVGGLVGSTVDTQIDNSSFSGIINSGGSGIGGLVGYSDCSIKTGGACAPGTSIISNSQVTGEISGYQGIGGLVGAGYGEINNSHADITVLGSYDAGGLIGWSQTSIDKSYSTGSVTSASSVGYGTGGIVGGQGSFTISNSYSSAEVIGADYVGGLAGYTNGDIKNSHAIGNVSIVTGSIGNYIGGIAGSAYESIISNSYAMGNVDGTSTSASGLRSAYLGGIAGELVGSTQKNSELVDSYSTGNVSGISNTGGLIGKITKSSIDNSFATGLTSRVSGVENTVGSFVGSSSDSYHNSVLLAEDVAYDFSDVPTSKINLLNHGLGSTVWASCSEIIGGAPHLASMRSTYSGSCSADESDSGSEDNPQPQRRERFQRELREVVEMRNSEKIEKSDGFEYEAPLPTNAGISFAKSLEKIDLTGLKTVEIAPTADVRVNTKTGESLQISFKSKSNEQVELWIQLHDGKWCFTGLITFNADGKAILPPLELMIEGEYLLVLNRPSADSAKGFAPMNKISSLLVAVN